MQVLKRDKDFLLQELSRLGIKNSILKAFREVPREQFVPENLREHAFDNTPLPIGYKQTISQPYVVALMCQLLDLKPEYKVLDIGTGSGYQAAILSKLVKKVVTIEVLPELAQEARQTFKKLKYTNIQVITKDGRQGHTKEAPYDGIKSAAASKNAPSAWKKQLRTGRKIIFPQKTNLGQRLVVLTKTKTGFTQKTHGQVAFVPLVNSKD